MSEPGAEMLTAAELAEVEAYIRSPENLALERETAERWARERGEPSASERYANILKANRTARGAKRRSAELMRTPSWADIDAIQAVYASARAISQKTGVPHHVDHEIPLQGKLVSGLHVHNNLQIITGSENSKKHNRFEIET